MLTKLKVQRPQPVRQQIADHVRELIVSGQLAPGTKLPSTQDLAKQWDSQPTTVQSALGRLVKEGLLDRAPRVGTFVRQRALAMEQVAIYLPEDVWDDPSGAFVQSVCAELTRELKQRGIVTTVRVHPPGNGRFDEPWPALIEAARRREFQALIAISVGGDQAAWLRQLPVPTAFLSEVSVPNRVEFDYGQFCDDSIAALKARGCRSVGLITSVERLDPDQPVDALKPFHQYFRQAAEEHGMEWREEWVKAFDHWHPFVGETLGYDNFRELWQAPTKPDSLVVFPDTVARGVLMGVASLQVDVPRDLKLILHRNYEVGLMCPVPATFMDVSIAEVSRALIGMVERQFKGEQAEPVRLRYEARENGATMGERQREHVL